MAGARLASTANQNLRKKESIKKPTQDGKRTEEVNLAELLKLAQKEFNEKDKTLDEELLQTQWAALRDCLSASMRAWDPAERSDSFPMRALNPPSLTHPPPLIVTEPDGFDPLAEAAADLGAARAIAVDPISQAVSLGTPAWKQRLKPNAQKLRATSDCYQ